MKSHICIQLALIVIVFNHHICYATYLATGAGDNSIDIWDLKTGDSVTNLFGHRHIVLALESVSQRELASGSLDHTIKLWDLETSECTRTLTEHTDAVLCLILVSTQPSYLASGSRDKTVRVWNTANGECIGRLDGHTSHVLALEMIVEWQILASGSDDKTIKLWRVDERECTGNLIGHTEAVISLKQVTPSGLASASLDHTIKLWNIRTEQCVRTLRGHSSGVLSLERLGFGLLASGSDDNRIKIWNLEMDGICEKTLSEHCGAVSSLQYYNNRIDHSYILVSGSSKDRTVRSWEMRSDSSRSLRTIGAKLASSIGYFKSGFRLCSADAHTEQEWPSDNSVLAEAHRFGDILLGGDLNINIWSLKSGKCVQKLPSHGECVRALLMLDDYKLAIGGPQGLIIIRSLTSGLELKTLKGHTMRANCLLRISHNRLASGSEDQDVRVWNLASGDCLLRLQGHASPVRSLQLVAKDQLASASVDGQIRIWNLDSGECVRLIITYTTYAMQFMTKNKQLAFASNTCGIYIHDSLSGEWTRTLKGHTHVVWTLELLDENTLASGSIDTHIRIWNVDSGQCVRTFTGHTEWVLSLRALPGDRLASGSRDKTIRIWNVNSGECIQSIQHTEYIETLLFVPSSAQFFTPYSRSLSQLVKYGLSNLWTFSSNIEDSVTGLNLVNANSYSFVEDRFGKANSAVFFNSGYSQLPSDVYFSESFSISAWVNVRRVENHARVIDCGIYENQHTDNVILALSHGTSAIPYFDLISNNYQSGHVVSSHPYTVNSWIHLALGFSLEAELYMNGQLVASKRITHPPRSITRTSCYIGKSNWHEDHNAVAYFDDIMFFKKGLSQEQVATVMFISISEE